MQEVTLKIIVADRDGILHLAPDDAGKEMHIIGDSALIVTYGQDLKVHLSLPMVHKKRKLPS